MSQVLTVRKVVQWGMGATRWLIIDRWYYGHHVMYVGKANLMHFQKVYSAHIRSEVDMRY